MVDITDYEDSDTVDILAHHQIHIQTSNGDLNRIHRDIDHCEKTF